MGEHEGEKVFAGEAAGLIEDGLIEIPIQVDLVPLPGLEDGEVPGLEGLGVEMEMLPLAVLEEPGVPDAIVMPPVEPPPPRASQPAPGARLLQALAGS